MRSSSKGADEVEVETAHDLLAQIRSILERFNGVGALASVDARRDSFMSAEAKRQKDVMVVLFRPVAFMAKHKLSLRLYGELVVLLQQSGVDVGDTDHSRITAREMNEVIAREPEAIHALQR